MRVGEVMSTNVETIKPGVAAVEAWELMRRKGIHHLVVMEDSTVAGILSERDTGGRNGANVRAHARVSDLMTAQVLSVTSDTTIRRAANLMRGRTIGCVPVIEGKRLVGILTVSDLLEILGGGADRPARPKRHELHYRVPHRKTKGNGRFGRW